MLTTFVTPGIADGVVMTRRYLAFDIETAKDVPGDDFNWRAHRPLGISCAAVLRCDAKEPMLWCGKKDDGTPAGRMSRDEARELVGELARLTTEGYTLLTWNGLGFDLDVLAEESGCRSECKELALDHVDMMFHVFCDRGFPVGLDKAAQGLGIPGKPEGMSGLSGSAALGGGALPGGARLCGPGRADRLADRHSLRPAAAIPMEDATGQDEFDGFAAGLADRP